ncbi:DUF5050 domain-containing protein [Niallia sp. NCCP-28]|uniref:DUF5050 domain-containing protein n=1 Tax=Niallia sp. NCCP-28 TaxID=2934712 RepID=UPI00208096B1|nr:DUF5050 domain-containing protein [Niallia sp. NCCP-28]GKU83547.1 hypothetical protein NCCP28_29430 [Niallia sp. NCCP-28]
MKKYFHLLLAGILLFLLFPAPSQAKSTMIYYPVTSTDKISAGIYKSAPNGKSSAVLKEKTYTLKSTKTPPLKLADFTSADINNKIATKKDFEKDTYMNNMPIVDVQAAGSDIYFTKFLFSGSYNGSYCGGGSADILEIYKQNSKGKITKVTTDKISTNTDNAFTVSGNYIYYAKVEKNGFSKFTIIKSTLDGKKKTTLKKAVDDFWISGNKIYYTSKNALYSMNLDGKKDTKISSIKAKLYNISGCDEGNYAVSNNGISYFDYNSDAPYNYYFDFSKGTVTKIKEKTKDGNYPYVVDVDLSKKRYIGITWNDDIENSNINVYNFDGKLIKKLMTTDFSNLAIHSIDAKTGVLLYVQGEQLKQIKF